LNWDVATPYIPVGELLFWLVAILVGVCFPARGHSNWWL